MSDKPFQFGLIVGRFQTLHKGHEDIVRRSLSLCDRTGILIGSPQEFGTENNPFTYELRKAFFELVFGDEVRIAPLPDIGIGNNQLWGEYVLETAQQAFGCLPDLAVSGKESRRTGWYTGPKGENVAELMVPKTIDISATLLRTYLVEDRRAEWQAFVSKKTFGLYPQLRAAVLSAQGNTETHSI